MAAKVDTNQAGKLYLEAIFIPPSNLSAWCPLWPLWITQIYTLNIWNTVSTENYKLESVLHILGFRPSVDLQHHKIEYYFHKTKALCQMDLFLFVQALIHVWDLCFGLSMTSLLHTHKHKHTHHGRPFAKLWVQVLPWVIVIFLFLSFDHTG